MPSKESSIPVPRPVRSRNDFRARTVRIASAISCTIAAAFAATSSVSADHPDSVQRLGRWLGVGWGDGYHVCRDGGFRPGADFPPAGYPDQFGAKKKIASTCGPVYPPGTALPTRHSVSSVPCECDNGFFLERETSDAVVSDPETWNIESDNVIELPEQPSRSKSVAEDSRPHGGTSEAVAAETTRPSWLEQAEPSPLDSKADDHLQAATEAVSPVLEQPQPVLEQPQPVLEQPQPVLEQPQPVQPLIMPEMPGTSPQDVVAPKLRFLPEVKRSPDVDRLPEVGQPADPLIEPVSEPLYDDSDEWLVPRPEHQGNSGSEPFETLGTVDFDAVFDDDSENSMPVQINRSNTDSFEVTQPPVRINPFLDPQAGRTQYERTQRPTRVAQRPGGGTGAINRAGANYDWNPVRQPE